MAVTATDNPEKKHFNPEGADGGVRKQGISETLAGVAEAPRLASPPECFVVQG